MSKVQIEIPDDRCFLCIDKSRYISWMFVDRWKPLGLPTDVNELVLAEIEEWFKEDE